MSDDDFTQPWREAAQAFDEGRAQEAVAKFEALFDHPRVGSNEKALLCLNLTTIHDTLGAQDKVMESFDRAAQHALQTFFMVQERRAQHLVDKGLNQEAIAVLEAMLANEFMAGERRAKCEESVANVKKHTAASASQWKMT